MSPGTLTQNFSDGLVGQILLLNDELGDNDGSTTFGQLSSMKPPKHAVSHTEYNEHPGGATWNGKTHRRGTGPAIRGWVQTTSAENLSRY
jgi:hypothetical protein